MLYQKLLVGKDPYFISVGESNGFQVHRHPEIELSYCLEGFCTIIINNKEYLLSAGDLAVVSPMAAHEFPELEKSTAQKLTIEVGAGLLGENFEPFTLMNPEDGIFKLKCDRANPLHGQLAALLDETAELFNTRPNFSALTVKGNLFKISALLLQLITARQGMTDMAKSMRDVEKIEKSLEIIYNRYSDPLDLDEVSRACGYSKSNFCKVFKSITGDTFHNVLNRHRIDIACMKLKESRASVEDIALSVGFSDTKSFCRVFKTVMGESSGEYKKKYSSR